MIYDTQEKEKIVYTIFHYEIGFVLLIAII